MYSLVEAWAWGQSEEELVDRSPSPWDSEPRRPSHQDKRTGPPRWGWPGSAATRLRFNATGDYATDVSYAVLPQTPGPVPLTLEEDDLLLKIGTGAITIQVFKQPFAVTVLNQNGDPVCADAGRGIVYVRESVANF